LVVVGPVIGPGTPGAQVSAMPEQVPVLGLQVPAVWHASTGLHVTAVPTQPPLLQTSPVVQALLSVQLIPFFVESAWQTHREVSPSKRQTAFLHGRQSGTCVLEHTAHAPLGTSTLETRTAAATVAQNSVKRARGSRDRRPAMLPPVR
jgi:hypothetical protein